jgi:hypothetical protein
MLPQWRRGGVSGLAVGAGHREATKEYAKPYDMLSGYVEALLADGVPSTWRREPTTSACSCSWRQAPTRLPDTPSSRQRWPGSSRDVRGDGANRHRGNPVQSLIILPSGSIS